MKINLSIRNAGFTLLEIIVTLIVASILGAMVTSMMGGVFTRSTQPAIQTMEIYAMNQVADNVARAYRVLGSTHDLQTEIGSGTFNQTYSGGTISVTAATTGYGTGSAPVEGGSADLLSVVITGPSGLTYALLFGDVEI